MGKVLSHPVLTSRKPKLRKLRCLQRVRDNKLISLGAHWTHHECSHVRAMKVKNPLEPISQWWSCSTESSGKSLFP